jgi:integrase
MAAKLKKTKTPGIFKRDNRYVVVYRDQERKQHKCFARTYDEARDIKAEVSLPTHRERSRIRFEDYAHGWIESYMGRTTRGFRESTRSGYRFSIEHRVIPFFKSRTPLLAEVEPEDVRAFITWLFEQETAGPKRKRKLSVATVRADVAALRALLATAREDGKITHNPAAGVKIARLGTPVIAWDPREIRKALESEKLARFLEACPPEWEQFFRLLAMTGIRIGEAVELRWGDVDFGAKRLRIRRQIYKGVVGEPKSDYGKRDVPLSKGLAQELWRRQGRPDELIFTNARGGRVDRDWLWKNVLKPTAKTAGVDWCGFHTFRHTCASVLFASGKNPKQVQTWLGHSDPGFTLRTYIHLIDDGLGDADFLDATTWAEGNKRATGATGKGAKATLSYGAEMAS